MGPLFSWSASGMGIAVARQTPSTTPVLRLWSCLSVLHTSSEVALGSLLAVPCLGAVPFLPDLLSSQKGFGFLHRTVWACQCWSVGKTTLLSPTQRL